MAKKSKRKFYRNVIQVEILSEDKIDLEKMNLHDVAYQIDEGDCSGKVVATVQNEEKTGEEIAKLLKAQNSDPEFFQLDKDGNDLDDDDEFLGDRGS